MIGITQYLEQVFWEFEKYVYEEQDLCKLKCLTFESGSIPDYADENVQQLYLLRYAFAYAFEYTQMYYDVLENMRECDHISVTSVGCGSMLDYWALAYALDSKFFWGTQIEYIGIDKINWGYRFDQRECDTIHWFLGNIIDYFVNINRLDSDIYFFPKSISELSEKDMSVIETIFSRVPIYKNRFFLCISLREDPGSIDRDLVKSKRIINAIKRNGFNTRNAVDEYVLFDGEQGIVKCDENFIYPEDALYFLKDLNTKCRDYIKNCMSNCSRYLNRWPILKTNHIRYQVIMFERTR